MDVDGELTPEKTVYEGFTNQVGDVVAETTPLFQGIRNNLGLTNLVERATADRINQTCRIVYDRSNKLPIPEILTVDQQIKLSKHFGRYNLEFTNRDNNDHGFAAALRRCEIVHLLSKTGYVEGKTYEHPVVTDIGGNFARSFRLGLTGIHHCSPVIDKIDSNRFTNRMNIINTVVRETKLNAIQINQFKDIQEALGNTQPSTEFVCLKKVQDCDIKTRYGIAVHSLYDICPKDLAEAMGKKDMVTVYASMMWDPTMVYSKEGFLTELNCMWERYTHNISGKERIRFAFKGDSSICYDHDFAVYLSWFMTTTIISKDRIHYIIEPLETVMGVAFFRINRIVVNGIASDTLINIRRWTNLEDKVIIRWQLSYYESFLPKVAKKIETKYQEFCTQSIFTSGGQLSGDQLKPNQKYNFCTNTSYEKILNEGRRSRFGSKFVEIAFLVDKDTVQQILAFILGSAEKKFCQPECFNYARSKCHAIIVGKDIISKGEQMDSRLLFLLSQVLYVYAWMLKYNHGIDMSNFMKVVGENRKLADASFFGKWFVKTTEGRLNRVKNWVPRRMNEKLYKYLKNKDFSIHNIISEAPAYYDLNNSFYEFKDTHWDMLFTDDQHGSLLPQVGVFRDNATLMDDVISSICCSRQKVKPDINSFHSFFYTPYSSDERRVIFLDQAVNIAKLMDNNKLCKNYFKNVNYIVLEYQPVSFYHHFVERIIKCFYVYDMEFNNVSGLVYLTIILKHSLLARFKRMDKKFYYERVGRVYNRLISDELVSNYVRTVRVCDGESIDCIPYLEEINKLKIYPIYSSVDNGSEITKAHAKLYELDKELDFRLCKILPGATVVDLASGPGTWSKYIIDNNADVFTGCATSAKVIACSLSNNGSMTDRFKHPCRVSYEEEKKEFSLLRGEDVDDFISYCEEQRTYTGIELVVADGGVDGAFPDQSDRLISLLRGEIKIALSILAAGGRFVLKFYFGESNDVTQLIAYLAQFFTHSIIAKPESSNKASAEAYFVGINYKSSRIYDFSVNSLLKRGYRMGLENLVYKFNLERYNYMQDNVLPTPLPPKKLESINIAKFYKQEHSKKTDTTESSSELKPSAPSPSLDIPEASIVPPEPKVVLPPPKPPRIVKALKEKFNKVVHSTFQISSPSYNKLAFDSVDTSINRSSFKKSESFCGALEMSTRHSSSVLSCPEIGKLEQHSTKDLTVEKWLGLSKDMLDETNINGNDSDDSFSTCGSLDLNTFKLQLLDGKEIVYFSNRLLPDIRQLRTPGDGNCLFYAMSLCLIPVNMIKATLLRELSSCRAYNDLNPTLRAEVVEILSNDNRWGITDIIDIYCEIMQVAIIELHANGSVIEHGEVFSDRTIYYVYYEDSHFSACINKRSVYAMNDINTSLVNLFQFVRCLPQEATRVNPFSVIDTSYVGPALLHIGSLDGDSIISSKRILSVRSLPSAIPFVLVFIDSEESQEPCNYAHLVYSHWSACENCKKKLDRNWFHHRVNSKILLGCSTTSTGRLVDDVTMCDLVVFPVEDKAPLVNFNLKSNLIGNKLTISLPYVNMSQSAVNTLVNSTLNQYNVFPLCTVGIAGTLQVEHMKFYNSLIQRFGSVYHGPLSIRDTYGYEFAYTPVLGNSKASIMMNAAMEIRAAYKVTINKVMQNCHGFYTRIMSSNAITKNIVFSDTSVNVYFLDTATWMKPPTKTYRYAYAYSETKKRGALITLTDLYSDIPLTRSEFITNMKSRDYAYLIVYRGTEVLLEPPLYDQLKDRFLFECYLDGVDVEIIRGSPGAGKTSYILNRHAVADNLKEVVLTATKNAALDLRERVKKQFPGIRFTNNNLRYRYATLESAILNPERYGDVTDVVYFDEAYLKHLGSCVWAAILLNAKKLVFVGDEAQVPYSDRNNLPLTFTNVKLLMDKLPKENKQFLRISRRIPRDAVTMINKFLRVDEKSMYEQDIQTTNSIERSIRTVIIKGITEVPSGFDHYLVFTQDEKQEMERKSFKVNTVHEYQGQQCEKIAIVRLKSTKNAIYDNMNQILTAFSRHTTECVYFSVVQDSISTIIRKLAQTVVEPSVVLGAGYVFNSARLRTPVENRINPRLNGVDMAPNMSLHLVPDYCVNINEEDSTLVDIVTSNNGSGFRGHYIVATETPYVPIPRMDPLPPIKTYDNTNILQYYFDVLRPGASLVPSRYLMEVFEYSDLVISSRNFMISPIRTIPTKHDTMTPVIRTSCPTKFYNSQKAFLKAYNERNGAVESVETAVKDPLVMETSIERFFKCYMKKGASLVIEEFKKSPIAVNVDSLTKWLSTQPPGVFEELKSLDSKFILDHITHKYSYMLKSVAKPKLEPNPETDFPSPQAIAYLQKLPNAIFCPIVQEMKKRIQFLLKDDKLLFTDMSVEVLEDVLTERIPKSKLYQIKKKYEIDFSKFDRSQRLWTLDFEANMMEKFGVPDELIEIWILVHRISLLIAHDVRFKAIVEYQRKSGDAMTYLGNTMWTMYVLMNLFGEEVVGNAFGMFGGDDSLILVSDDVAEIDYSTIFNTSQSMFNMELKIIKVRSFYFCSRFIIFSPLDERWYIVPDPLKALIKLGRRDLVNKQHAKEYMISLRDNWVNYSNSLLYDQINFNFCDRYSVNIDISLLLSAMFNLVSHEDEFLNLYYWHDNDEESVFAVLPNLEM